MLNDTQKRRYARNIALPELGERGQEKLCAASVLVVGAGGLGAPVIAYLAAAGIGRIGIADHDRVELSNLQRQILFETADIGRPKVEAAADRAQELNPEVHVVPHAVKLSPDNAHGVIGDYDIVADTSDNFATRFAVNAACLTQSKPLVSAAIRGFAGQVAVFKPYFADDQPCYRCFVSGAPDDERGCRDAGVLGAWVGAVGAMQGLEVIKELLGIGESLSGQLLSMDGLAGSFRKTRIMRDPECECCGIINGRGP